MYVHVVANLTTSEMGPLRPPFGAVVEVSPTKKKAHGARLDICILVVLKLFTIVRGVGQWGVHQPLNTLAGRCRCLCGMCRGACSQWR